MKRILVCTDFLPPGNNAAEYAAMLAVKLDAGLFILNCTKKEKLLSYSEAAEDKFHNAETAMLQLTLHLSELTGHRLNVKTEVKDKLFFTGLNMIIKSWKPDLVVLGSWRNSLHAGILGSKAVYAGRNLKLPFIVVPGQYRYENIQAIGLASDLRKSSVEAVFSFKKIVDELGASVHVLYAETADQPGEKQYQEARALVNLLGTEHHYHAISSKNVDDDVMDFLQKKRVQLLAVISRRHTIFQRLFHPSHSIHFIRYSTIPVLVFRAPAT
jgi:nucleotide-binding universal stress UspA family protein